MTKPKAPEDRLPLGQPSTYTPEKAAQICERIADGESLRTICLDEAMPGRATVLRWLGEWPEFRDQYAQAREMQADAKFDEAWDIAHKAKSDDVAVARLQVDTIKWQTAKLAPRKYGERLELAGQVTVARVSRKPISEEEWEQQHSPTDPAST